VDVPSRGCSSAHSWSATRLATSPRFHPVLTMPTPKFLRDFSSKSSSEDFPDANPDSTPTVCPEEILPETSTIADPNAPQHSDAINEAWNAANAELRRAHGVERFLNGIGTRITSVPRGTCVLMLVKQRSRTR